MINENKFCLFICTWLPCSLLTSFSLLLNIINLLQFKVCKSRLGFPWGPSSEVYYMTQWRIEGGCKGILPPPSLSPLGNNRSITPPPGEILYMYLICNYLHTNIIHLCTRSNLYIVTLCRKLL